MKFQFPKTTCWRAMLPVACLLFNGCALLFTEGESQIGTVPREPSTRTVVRTVLRRDARSLRFECADPKGTILGQDRVTVMLTNTSTSKTIEVQNPGAFANVPPHTSVLLYDGSLSALLNGKRLSVSSWSGRASCELHIQFASAPTLPAPIRVLCSYSSPPL